MNGVAFCLPQFAKRSQNSETDLYYSIIQYHWLRDELMIAIKALGGFIQP